jgi:hypothetical protein
MRRPAHQEKQMTKATRLALVLLLVAVAQFALVPGPFAAESDRARIAREQEQTFFEQATKLHRTIQQGWSFEAVAGIMGSPSVVARGHDGHDDVETWWYHSYEVGIEFRNGAVSHWFFRFILR